MSGFSVSEDDLEFINKSRLERRFEFYIDELYNSKQFTQIDLQIYRVPYFVVREMVDAIYKKDAKYLVMFSVEIIVDLHFRCGVPWKDIYLVVGSQYKRDLFPQITNALVINTVLNKNPIRNLVYKTMAKDIRDNLIIIGNPPYNEGVGTLYDKFIDMAIEMQPKTVCMITPSRWLTNSGKTKKFYDKYIGKHSFKKMKHFDDATKVFENTDIKGGVNWFVYQVSYDGKCEYNGQERFLDESIDPRQDSIIAKANAINLSKVGDTMLGSRPYDIRKSADDRPVSLKQNDEQYPIYLTKSGDRGYWFVDKTFINKNIETIDKYKVLINLANGGQDKHTSLPLIISPGEICSESFLVVFYSSSLDECKNFVKYLTSEIFQFLFSINKAPQDISQKLFKSIPNIDYSKAYNNDELYSMFGITNDEKEFINELITTNKTMIRFFDFDLVKDFDNAIDSIICKYGV